MRTPSNQAGVAAGLAVVGLILVEGLLNVTANSFRLDRWRWWMVAVTVAVTASWAVYSGIVAWHRERRIGAAPWCVTRPDDMVARAEPARRLASRLLEGVPIAVTTGLYGAGGFGKTTLARQVCNSRPVRQRFTGGAFEIAVGDQLNGAELAAKIGDLIRLLGADAPAMTDPDQVGRHLGEVLRNRRGRVLLLVDDIWRTDQLQPFLHAGERCTVLVTTRRASVLPNEARINGIRVDQMTSHEATMVLERGLRLPDGLSVASLIRLTGRWPLLMALVNRHLVTEMLACVDPEIAVAGLVERLHVDGPDTLDVADEVSRERAVGACVQASLTKLCRRHCG